MVVRMKIPVLLLASLFITLVSLTPQSANFRSIPGCEKEFILPDKPFLVITALSTLDCAFVCARTSGCYSFNICPDGLSFTCSLIAKFSTTGCAALVSRTECKHREHVNAAALEAANPCCNGGSFVGGVCVCVWGFAGPLCCRLIYSCREGKQLGINNIGFYDIQPPGSSVTYNVYCNCASVGTIWAFRRILPPPPNCPPLSYNRTWEEYKNGFGDINCEYFLGLEAMFQLNSHFSYQFNIYNVLTDGSVASVYLESASVKSEAQNYEIDFIREFTNSWEHGDDHFDETEKPRSFCTWDRDCNGCAKSVGGGWWFTSTCGGGAITAPLSQMFWPKHGVDKAIAQTFLQMDQPP